MRKTATYITCDNPDCSAVVEQPGENHAVPDGWYVVVLGNPHLKAGTAQRDLREGFTLCGLECVATWAMEREEVLGAAGRTPDRAD